MVKDRPFASGLPVAAADWELRAHGYALREEPLTEVMHTMAVPPGENEWLVRVDEHLLRSREQIEESLGVEQCK